MDFLFQYNKLRSVDGGTRHATTYSTIQPRPVDLTLFLPMSYGVVYVVVMLYIYKGTRACDIIYMCVSVCLLLRFDSVCPVLRWQWMRIERAMSTTSDYNCLISISLQLPPKHFKAHTSCCVSVRFAVWPIHEPACMFGARAAKRNRTGTHPRARSAHNTHIHRASRSVNEQIEHSAHTRVRASRFIMWRVISACNAHRGHVCVCVYARSYCYIPYAMCTYVPYACADSAEMAGWWFGQQKELYHFNNIVIRAGAHASEEQHDDPVNLFMMCTPERERVSAIVCPLHYKYDVGLCN